MQQLAVLCCILITLNVMQASSAATNASAHVEHAVHAWHASVDTLLSVVAEHETEHHSLFRALAPLSPHHSEGTSDDNMVGDDGLGDAFGGEDVHEMQLFVAEQRALQDHAYRMEAATSLTDLKTNTTAQFTCRRCNPAVAFSRRHDLSEHLLREHRAYLCPSNKCMRVFSSSSAVGMHTRREHPGCGAPFTCLIDGCHVNKVPANFKTLGHYWTHMERVHGVAIEDVGHPLYAAVHQHLVAICNGLVAEDPHDDVSFRCFVCTAAKFSSYDEYAEHARHCDRPRSKVQKERKARRRQAAKEAKRESQRQPLHTAAYDTPTVEVMPPLPMSVQINVQPIPDHLWLNDVMSYHDFWGRGRVAVASDETVETV